MLEYHLMSIELVVLDPVIPNAIIKQTNMTCKAQTNSWQQLKPHKLHLGLCLVLQPQAILGG